MQRYAVAVYGTCGDVENRRIHKLVIGTDKLYLRISRRRLRNFYIFAVDFNVERRRNTAACAVTAALVFNRHFTEVYHLQTVYIQFPAKDGSRCRLNCSLPIQA